MQIAFGALLSQALYVAAKLGIADLLADGPKGAAELAEATATHERSLYRVLRSLASAGVFREIEPKRFELTYVGDALRTGVPGSLRSGAIFMGEEWHWRVWGNLLYSVRTGQPAWGHVHGQEVFDYFGANSEPAEIFNDAMTDMSAGSAAAVIAGYDFSGASTLVDVAGGHGTLLGRILEATPGLRGVLFDMPHVAKGATATFERLGVSDRVEIASGSFFESVPSGGDLYIMRNIIHDWDDERSIAILRNIREAMGEGSKLLVLEMVVPEGDEPHFAKVIDLEMLVSPGGVEPTAKEYDELLAAAGLRMTRIVPTMSPFSIVEAERAAEPTAEPSAG
jgi:hypothetical protein